jgi:acetyl-CoA C-acetyltransferase
MESFAVQAIAWSKTLAFDQRRLNRGGGALARGHPIAASGAILIVRLFHELMKEVPGSIGLSAIAAAGGLGSSMLLQKC